MTDQETISIDEAVAAEDARYAAQMAGDFDALDRLLADDLVYVHASGAVDDKFSYMATQRSKALEYRSMKRHEATGRIYGRVAIITGRGEFEVTVSGEERTVHLLFHSVWAKRGPVVQFVSWQATLAPGVS